MLRINSLVAKFIAVSVLGLMLFAGSFLFLDLLCPLNLSKLELTSPQYLSDQGDVLQVNLTQDQVYRLPIELNEVSHTYLKLLLVREDKRFYSHSGIDVKALLRAFVQCVTHQKIVSGASTLTMQTAKLLTPRKRSLSAKLIEMFRALQLEWHYSKDDILKMYLTLVPCGGNIEGIKAASHTYFGKKPDRLSVAEATLLVMLPQSPTQLRPDKFPEAARLKRDYLLTCFKDKNLISEHEFSYALTEDVPVKRYSFPRLIPHLVSTLNSSSKVTETFIQKDLQLFIADLLARTQKIPTGANAGIMVHDHVRNRVIAYVGSRNFFDQNCAGQVDFVQAVRSPGSTLKPLIYGLALDEGYMTPDTYFFDERKHYGAYAPRNFDHQHYGLVRGAESLQMSLNIPAVDLLKKIGPIHFYGAMKNIDLNPKFKHAGVMPNLSMALGGVGLSLCDLVRLYSTFAQGGMARSLRYTKTDEAVRSNYLLYPYSARQLTAILKINPLNRPGHLDTHQVALKTGTSYGARDALCLAYDGRYTVGVWIGKPDGTSMGEYTGLDLAAPFIEDIFKKLPSSLVQENEYTYVNQAPAFKVKQSSKEYEFVKAVDLVRRPLTIKFPVSGSVLFSDFNKSLQLKVGGGTKPYKLFVNGRLFQENIFTPTFSWLPPEKGFYCLTIQDADGHISHTEIEIQR